MGFLKKGAGKAGKKTGGKAVRETGSGGRGAGKTKNEIEADRVRAKIAHLTDEQTATRTPAEQRAWEASIWDLDGAKKQWAVGAGAVGIGAGYLGLGHQGKQGKNKKKDDTLKFLGY